MTGPTFRIRPTVYPGAWLTNHRRYYEYLRFQLADLEDCQAFIDANWPDPEGAPIAVEHDPALHKLCRRRDAITDSIVVFAAMTVEGTLNYYGVRRMGEKQFAEHFERLSMERKLRVLLLLCDGFELGRDAPILKHLARLSALRNALVHPKAAEVSPDISIDERTGRPNLETAREAIAECDAFLDELAAFIPRSHGIDPRPVNSRGDG